MLNSTPSNLDAAKRFARAFLNDTNTWAVNLHKPIFLEEFGMARNNWENVDEEYLYLSSAGTSNRDEYFETVIGEVVKYFMMDQQEQERDGTGGGVGAYIGSCPWAYGGVWRPESQKVDEYGMVWAGDPPHESPGWYDVYDGDKGTLGVIRRQAEVVGRFLGKGRAKWTDQ